jgi:hypothetical protein
LIKTYEVNYAKKVVGKKCFIIFSPTFIYFLQYSKVSP